MNRETVEKHEQFQWFLAPALALLALAELISERRGDGKGIGSAIRGWLAGSTRRPQRGQA